MPSSSFEQLPPEILCSIAQFVGSEDLRARGADNLLLFKNWWRVARVVAFEDLTLSIKTIDRYLEAAESIQNLVQTSVKSLKLTVMKAEGKIGDHRIGFPLPEARTTAISDAWWIHARETLFRLAPRLKQMRRMQSFNLVFFVFLQPSQVRDSAAFTSMSTLLSSLPTTLASLTVDNSGAPSAPASGSHDSRNHFCSLLHDPSLPPNLRHLRIRSRNICPEIFEGLPSGLYTHLESLIVSISLGPDDLPFLTKVFYSHLCPRFQFQDKILYPSMVDAAKAIVPRLPCLQTLRVIHQNFPAEDLVSFDVVHDRRVVIPPGTDWKALEYVNANGDDNDLDGGSDWSRSPISSLGSDYGGCRDWTP